MTNMAKNIDFLIEHIDPLGQGVFKKEDLVFFIPKTLPGESGTATIYKKKKGVHFASVDSLQKESPNRIKPECTHYLDCSGCHYLHADYKTETTAKFSNFKRMISFLDIDVDCDYIEAPKRLGYRNRIQLHYNKKMQKLGFVDGKNNRIIEVPNCLIPSVKIQETLNKLYKNNHWLTLCQNEPIKGHIEVYEKDDQILINWNEKYSFGGFTQVFPEMNIKLLDLVQELNRAKDSDIIFDIFGGNGNLSNQITAKKYILDFYTKPKSEDNFFHLDLFEEESLYKFKDQSNLTKANHFLIDPPRKGFPLLNEWAREFMPETMTYVSCHPQTMARDLKSLKGYKIVKAFMLDLFPSTFHFEACVFLEKSP